MSDKYDEASKQKKPVTDLVADTRFNPPKKSDLTIRYGADASAGASAPIRPPAQIPPGPQKRKAVKPRANPKNYTSEVAELTRRGVGEGMAVTMFTVMRTKLGSREAARRWLRQLLAYGKHRDAEDNEIHEGGWYNRTYEKWRDGKADSWPDDAMLAIERAEAAFNKSPEGRGLVPKTATTPPEAPQRPADASFELPPSLPPLPPGFDSFLTYKPAQTETAAAPTVSPPLALLAPPPALLAAWPDVRKEAKAVFNAGLYNLVQEMKPAQMETGDGGTVITLRTGKPFAKKTLDDKPQQLAVLAHLFADAFALPLKTVAVRIVVMGDG